MAGVWPGSGAPPSRNMVEGPRYFAASWLRILSGTGPWSGRSTRCRRTPGPPIAPSAAGRSWRRGTAAARRDWCRGATRSRTSLARPTLHQALPLQVAVCLQHRVGVSPGSGRHRPPKAGRHRRGPRRRPGGRALRRCPGYGRAGRRTGRASCWTTACWSTRSGTRGSPAARRCRRRRRRSRRRCQRPSRAPSSR